MKFPVARWAGAVVVSLAMAMPALSVQAAVAAGSLVKASGSSAVYWYGTDGKRHAFPSAAVYATWFADFGGVKTVSASELAAMPLGATVKYRPGTRLIKLATDPKVYAVEPDGVLRWVPTEDVALSLFGAGWAKRIDDVPDTFFVDYRVGVELEAARPPVGAVVRAANGQLNLVGVSQRQPLSGEAAAFLGQFAVADNGWLNALPAGVGLSVATPPYGETAVTYPATPTFSFVASPANFSSPDTDVTLGVLQLTTGQALQVRRLGLKFLALQNASGSATPDADRGGLVYGNSVRANFSRVRLIDESGRVVFEARDFNLNSDLDQEQSLSWTGDWRVAARSQARLRVVADIGNDVPNGETYRISFLPGVADVRDAATSAAAAILPTGPISDDIKQVIGTAVSFSATTAQTTVVRGATGITLFKFTVAAGARDTAVNQLIFRSYLSTGSSSAYLEGGNVDGGVEVRTRSLVPKVSLYEGDQLIAGPVDLDFSGRAIFANLGQTLKASTSRTWSLVGDVAKTASIGSADMVAFDFAGGKDSADVKDDLGNTLDAVVTTANLASGSPRQYVRVKPNGRLQGEWQAISGEALCGTVTQVGTLSLTATDEAYTVDVLSFRQDGAALKSYAALRLDYPDRDGKTVSKRLDLDGFTSLTFTGLGAYVPAGKTVQAKLYAEVVPYVAGPTYDEELKVRLVTTGPLQFTSANTGDVRDEAALGTSTSDDYYFKQGQANSLHVRFSTFTVLSESGAPSGTVSRSDDVEVLRFGWKVEGSGRVRVRKATFRVTPADAGRDGRDLLEYWASKVGSLDANSVISLVRVDSNGNETVIGEDAVTSLRYRVCGGGSSWAEPASGFTSKSGQYAEFVYDFNPGSEYALSAGETNHFRLKLDTSGFWKADADYKGSTIAFSVSALGYSDLIWTDAPGLNYSPRAANSGMIPVTANLYVDKS